MSLNDVQATVRTLVSSYGVILELDLIRRVGQLPAKHYLSLFLSTALLLVILI